MLQICKPGRSNAALLRGYGNHKSYTKAEIPEDALQNNHSSMLNPAVSRHFFKCINPEGLFRIQEMVSGKYEKHKVRSASSHNIFLLLPQIRPVEQFGKIRPDKSRAR